MRFKIAGVKFHQYKTILDDIVEGDSLMIAPEPENKFDPNAVALYYDNGSKQAMLGYVPKTMSSEVSAMIEVGKQLDCVVTGFNPTASPWDIFEVEIKEIEDE
jgi:hypothetical protein